MSRDRKPLTYLVTAECTHLQPEGYSRRIGTYSKGGLLTHRAFRTVKTEYAHCAEQVANDLQQSFALEMANKLTRTEVDSGPAGKVRMIPCETLSSVTVKVERYKHKSRKPPGMSRPHERGRDIDHLRNKAIAYAHWIAKRDGLTIPSEGKIEIVCDADSVDLPGEKLKRKFWNGTREIQKTENRIKSVSWGHRELVEVPERKMETDGYIWRAHSYQGFIADLTIEIPNWDFVPNYTEETANDLAA